jgi:hypothetical protein
MSNKIGLFRRMTSAVGGLFAKLHEIAAAPEHEPVVLAEPPLSPTPQPQRLRSMFADDPEMDSDMRAHYANMRLAADESERMLANQNVAELGEDVAYTVSNVNMDAIFRKSTGSVCGFASPTPGYGPCTRPAGHPGPCAHPFA